MTGSLVEAVRGSPDLPGVYLFRDEEDRVLYVGKALSLRKRLQSYLPALRGDAARAGGLKVLEMADKARGVEWIVTSSEAEALLLEANLIKQSLPPYNIRLRDDKSYPYIAITMQDEFPRVVFTRQPHRRGSLYFGPYASAAKVRETLDALSRIFPFRKCRGAQPGRRSGSPCLQHDIERCPAPCVGGVSRDEYRRVVQQVIDFLQGRQDQVLRELTEQMKVAAEARDFERAALYRDRLAALRHVLERQQVASSLGTVDVIGMARDERAANVQVFLTRDGVLAGRRSFTLEGVEGAGDQEVFERFFADYFGSALFVPPEVVVPKSVENLELLAAFLERMRAQKVTVKHAERGDKKRLQALAEKNALLALEADRRRAESAGQRRLAALEGLKEVLGLGRLPLRIEGFDISNLGPEHIVASMVVFEGGAPRKADYRRFAIRGLEGQDDVGALREALSRRFGRTEDNAEDTGASAKHYDASFEAAPDLLLIDGGRPQLGAAVAALAEAGLTDAIPVVCLAKREEELFVPGGAEPLRLARDDPALLLLEHVRDEAHRFAVSFHRVRRKAAATESLLDGLPGIGTARKRAILTHFGSPEGFLHASREELEAVPGLPGKVARNIYNCVHKTG